MISVVFETFDLRQSVDAAYGDVPQPATTVPESITNWLDDLPRIGVDAQGVPIVLHIPNWQKKTSLVRESISPCPSRLIIRVTIEYLQ
jgi:hypothetical protein